MKQLLTALAMTLLMALSASGQFTPQQDSRTYGGPAVSPMAFLTGDILQGPAIHLGLAPLGVCYDAAGSVYGVPTLYVADLNDGLTFLYDATDLSPLGDMASPAGVTEVSGITTDGTFLYWVADETLYRTDMSGGALIVLGALDLPGGGIAGDLCLGPLGDAWVVDIQSDIYSRHSLLDGSYQGESFSSPGGSDAFGLGVALRPDCDLFEVPSGSLADGQVTEMSIVDPVTGLITSIADVGFLGAFIAGIDVAETSPTYGVYSYFVVEAATGTLIEVEGTSPCPLPQPDCHASPGLSDAYAYDLPRTTLTVSPGFPITSILPTTASQLIVAGLVDPVQDLECHVQLTHSWISDLDITLTGPGGVPVVQLHDSAGLDSDDIDTLFTQSGRPYGMPFNVGDAMRASGPGAMTDFDGLDGNGSWTLAVTDNFFGEDGTLDAWSIAVPQAESIPDGDLAGLSATVEVPAGGPTFIADLDVVVNISHDAIANLIVELTSPSGTVVRLHDQSGAGAILSARYDDDPAIGGDNDGYGTALPAGPGLLSDFDEEDPTGMWTLSVIDPIAGSVGVLEGWELLICGVDCDAPTGLVCTPDCATGEVTLEWINGDSYADISVLRDGLPVATLAGGETQFVDFPGEGVFEYSVVGSCDVGSGTVTCTAESTPFGGQSHVVLRGEGAGGLVDSAGALSDSLTALGLDHLLVNRVDYPCLNSMAAGSTVWVCLGTSPDNHVLTADEGQQLADLAASGVNVYLESNDHWGFDPVTAFADHDGVESATDGDGSFIAMVGLAHEALDVTDLAATYTEDQVGSDSTDQLLPTPPAGAVWRDGIDSYTTGVYAPTLAGTGNVLVQSWELGGYDGDRDELVSRYVLALSTDFDPAVNFIRGEVNQDGGVDIADAVFILGHLFVAGSSVPGCVDSADSNDDGGVDIADAVFLLGHLFVGGSPSPPAPFPGCGSDPTPDSLDCDNPGSC